jgi:cytoskeletal protein CcmA (bactofilin family)
MEMTYEWFKEQIDDKKRLKWFMRNFPLGVTDYQQALELAEEVCLEEWFIEKLGSHDIYNLYKKTIDVKKLIRAGSVFCDGPMHVDFGAIIAGNLEVNGRIYVGDTLSVFGDITCHSSCISDRYLFCKGTVNVKEKVKAGKGINCAKSIKAKEIYSGGVIEVGGDLKVEGYVCANDRIRVGGDFECPEIITKGKITVGGQLNSKEITPVSWDREIEE